MDKRLERRLAPASLRVERRAEGEGPRLRGHAAVFDRPSLDLGGFVEVIKPGAFARALERSDVRALWNHNSDIVLGRGKSGTLEVEEDEQGLAVAISPPSSAAAYVESVERGDVDQMSFAFWVAKGGDKWESLEGGGLLRTIHEFEELYDVSPVTFPAYPDTDVALRRLELFRAADLCPPPLGELEAAKLRAERSLFQIGRALAGGGRAG